MSSTFSEDVQMTNTALAGRVREALLDVHDPEIPSLSIVDLGMVHAISATNGDVQIELMPTFVGCPALPLIRRNVEKQLQDIPDINSVQVKFVMDEPWTSERISPTGKLKLKEYGIASPRCGLFEMQTIEAQCPYCDSENTRVENLFGPTACRAVFYCNDCHQPFEMMKPV